MFGPLAMAGRPNDQGDDFSALQARLESAREVVTDPGRTSFRVVTVPEGMAIAETERLVERLHEADVQVDRLLVNRLLEDLHEGCPRCRTRRERHQERVAEIRETILDLVVTTLPEREGEVQGLEALGSLTESVPPAE